MEGDHLKLLDGGFRGNEQDTKLVESARLFGEAEENDMGFHLITRAISDDVVVRHCINC